MLRTRSSDRPIAYKILSKVAKVVKHAAQSPFDFRAHGWRPVRRARRLSNWELSAARANTTRRLLEQAGVAEDRIAQVVGKAGSEPLYPDNTIASANRRISIVLFGAKPRSCRPASTLTPKAGVVNDTGLAAPPLGQNPASLGSQTQELCPECVRRNRLISESAAPQKTAAREPAHTSPQQFFLPLPPLALPKLCVRFDAQLPTLSDSVEPNGGARVDRAIGNRFPQFYLTSPAPCPYFAGQDGAQGFHAPVG